MIEFLHFLSNNHHASIAVWFLLAIILGKTYEATIDNKIGDYFKFLKSRDSEVAFGIVFLGLLMLLLAVIAEFLGERQFMWYVLSLCGILGGILAFIPFSFMKKGTEKERKEKGTVPKRDRVEFPGHNT